MSFLRTLNLKYLLACSLVLPLASCSSGGDGGDLPTKVSFGDLGLAWTVPGAREDGSTMLSTEIESYRIYYGTEPGDYQNQVDVDVALNVVDIPQLPIDTYYVVVTAVDTEGRESLYSSEVVIKI